jgi:hypothetical protein
MASFLEELRQNSFGTTVEFPENQEPAGIPMVENAEPENRIIKRIMESRVFGGQVEVIFNLVKPDQATVDGVTYLSSELVNLSSKGLSHAQLNEIHELKKMFEGFVLSDAETSSMENHSISKW